MIQIIMIAGPKGSGKSEVAKHFTQALPEQWIRLSFGDPMKRMLQVIGVPYHALWGNDEAKNQPQEVLGGETTRKAMVTLATEWGRDIINPNLWVLTMQVQLSEMKHRFPKANFIIDDLRFQNEYDWGRNLGAQIIGIQRGELPPQPPDLHISEQMPYRFEELGIPVVKNDSSIADMNRKVVALTTLPP